MTQSPQPQSPSPQPSQWGTIIALVVALFGGSPTVFALVENATEDPGTAVAVVIVYLIGLTGVTMVTGIWKILKEYWIPLIAEWVKAVVEDFFHHRRRAYRRYVIEEHRFVNVTPLHIRPRHSLMLQQVFVDLRLKEDFKQNHDCHTIWDFLQFKQLSSHHFAILGLPGTGKTTLLRNIALVLASRRSVTTKKIPILLFLRDHAPTIQRNQDFPLVEVVHTYLIQRGGPSLPQHWFKRQLQAGNCVVMLDGLDEVADPEIRKGVVTWVERQMRAWPGNRFIVTSRPFGYHTNPLSGVAILDIQPFTDSQVKEFVQNWYLANEIIITQRDDAGVRREAQRKTDDLLRRLYSAPHLAAMAINPLLLTMIAHAHQYEGALPTQRVALYQKICQVFLEDHQQPSDRGLDLTPAQKQKVLQPLAHHMMTEKVSEIPKQDALSIISKALESEVKTPKAADKAAAFLEWMNDRSGLLLMPTDERYSFAHLTFQEYLAAVHIAMRAEQGLEALLGRLGDLWWHETIRLYAAQPNVDATPIIDDCLSMRRFPVPSRREEPLPPHPPPDDGHWVQRFIRWVVRKILGRSSEASPPPLRPLPAPPPPPQNELSREERFNRWLLALAIWEEDAVKLQAGTRTRLDERLTKDVEDHDAPQWRIIVEVLLRRRSHQLLRLDENRYIDTTLITHAEYQLFLDDCYAEQVYHQPDHWSGKDFPAGQGRTPIVGIRPSDADAFCTWLTHHDPSGWRYRLPTPSEATTGITGDDTRNTNPSRWPGIGYWVKGVDGFTCQMIGTPDTTMPRGWLHQRLKQDLTLTCALALVPLLPSIIGGHTDNASKEARARADRLRNAQTNNGTAILLQDLDHTYIHASHLRHVRSHVRTLCQTLAHKPETAEPARRVSEFVDVLQDACTHVDALMAVLAVHGVERHCRPAQGIADILKRVLERDAATRQDRRQFLSNHADYLNRAREEIYEKADELLRDITSDCVNAWINASAHAWAFINSHQNLDDRTSALADLCARALSSQFTDTNANVERIATTLLDTDMLANDEQHPAYTINLDQARTFAHDTYVQERTNAYTTTGTSNVAQEFTDATPADVALATTLDTVLNRTLARCSPQNDELRAARWYARLCTLILAMALRERARWRDLERERLAQSYLALYVNLALLEERMVGTLPASESIRIVKERNS